MRGKGARKGRKGNPVCAVLSVFDLSVWVLKEKKERERVYCVVEVVFKKILIYLRKK